MELENWLRSVALDRVASRSNQSRQSPMSCLHPILSVHIATDQDTRIRKAPVFARSPTVLLTTSTSMSNLIWPLGGAHSPIPNIMFKKPARNGNLVDKHRN
uniref:Uncharacterized protein n=1 Tax=Spongospora subterranea TaxID=70186 RepID=A0A0H5QU98_9EUKA|eukprot:CRZ05475.1 hypothetical protein [Spongospora subterranea]